MTDAPMPGPDFLSEQARAVLAEPRVDAPSPRSTTPRAGCACIEAGNAENRAQYEGVEFPVQVEEREIAGVPTYVLRSDEVADPDRTPVYLDIHGGALIYGGGDAARLSWLAHGRRHRPGALGGRLPGAAAAPLPRGARRRHGGVPGAAGRARPVGHRRRRRVGRREPGRRPDAAGQGRGAAAAGRAGPAHAGGRPDRVRRQLRHRWRRTTTPSAACGRSTCSTRAGRELADPYLSPLFGDLSGFPPTLLTAGHAGPLPLQHGPDAPQAPRGRGRRGAARVRGPAARRVRRRARGPRGLRRAAPVPRPAARPALTRRRSVFAVSCSTGRRRWPPPGRRSSPRAGCGRRRPG